MPADQNHPETRSDPRYKARIAVFHGPNQNELLTNYSVNISASGIFIETDSILPVDTEIVVKFKLPGADRIIAANVRVMWTNEPGATKKASLPPGMGLRFLDLSLDDLHAVRAFLETGELVPTW